MIEDKGIEKETTRLPFFTVKVYILGKRVKTYRSVYL